MTKAAAIPRSFALVLTSSLGYEAVELVAPHSVVHLAMQAAAQAQVLEVGERLGQGQPFLEEHDVAAEELAGHLDRRSRTVPEQDLVAAPEPVLVMRLDRTGALGPLLERPAVSGQREGRLERGDLVERV